MTTVQGQKTQDRHHNFLSGSFLKLEEISRREGSKSSSERHYLKDRRNREATRRSRLPAPPEGKEGEISCRVFTQRSAKSHRACTREKLELTHNNGGERDLSSLSMENKEGDSRRQGRNGNKKNSLRKERRDRPFHVDPSFPPPF